MIEGYFSPQVDCDVRLNTNESPYPPPKSFIRAFNRKMKGLDLNRYPSREAEGLKRAILDFYGLNSTESGDDTDTPDVVVGNGSNEVLQALVLSLTRKRAKTKGTSRGRVGLFEPTYGLHTHISEMAGAEVIAGKRNDAYRVELDELEKILSKGVDIVFLCSPNNPTGTSEEADFLEKALELCAGAGSVMVIDEAYGEFGTSPASFDLLKKRLPLLLVRTFSKSWSLAGMRLGFGIGSRRLIEDLTKAFLPYNLSAAAQLAGELVLQFSSEMEASTRKLAADRDAVFQALLDINQRCSTPLKIWESSSNFIFFKVLKGSAENIWQKLISRSILIRYYGSSPLLADCLRVTIGTPKENKLFLEAFGEILIEEAS